jgi:hypothetical protein
MTHCWTGKVKLAALTVQSVQSTDTGANASAPTARVPTATKA